MNGIQIRTIFMMGKVLKKMRKKLEVLREVYSLKKCTIISILMLLLSLMKLKKSILDTTNTIKPNIL